MKKMIILTLIVITMILTGCTVIEEPINLSSMPPRKAEPNSTSSPAAIHKQEESLRQSVNAALIWSEKYEKLMTEMETLKKYSQNLQDENQKLKNNIKTQEKQLNQTQKELKEANDLLISMRLELNSWKKDILGFREEMRQSQQAILAANVKILRELGAEVRETSVTEQVANND